ncbi:helix-turn-helix domain-containing protein, partial [Escherichia coli]|nr:helix-turn-helix domain-containing protein [Escherichia coli]
MDAKTSDMGAAPGLETTEQPEATGRRSRVSGIDRALQVLDYLYETGSPAGVYGIAKAIGAPLSTVYVIIDDLVEKNLLSRNND